MKNDFNFIDAAAAYQKSIKGRIERQEKRKREVWEAIEREAAAGNFCLTEEWLSKEVIGALEEKGFEVTYFRGMFGSGDYFKISWSKDENENES